MVSSRDGLIIINFAQFDDSPKNTPYKATRLTQILLLSIIMLIVRIDSK